jgi:DNA-binding transcriptional ArsR family regulator
VDHSQLTDYPREGVLVVDDPVQLRALGAEVRARVVTLLRERAASVSELALVLGIPKGTVGHHVKVLEQAGLIRVVATRRVRAVTEKYYGRVASLFVLQSDDALPSGIRAGALGSLMLRQAADELAASGDVREASAILHARLKPADLRRFQRRLNRLAADFQTAQDPEGETHALTYALFQAGTRLPPPRGDDA